MRYQFHPVAIQQQEDIWLHTYDRWGEVQADNYIDGLHEQIKKVADNPALLKNLRRMKIDRVCFFRYKRHYIFVREPQHSDNELYILSILHDAMDIPVRLEELLNEL